MAPRIRYRYYVFVIILIASMIIWQIYGDPAGLQPTYSAAQPVQQP